MVSTAGLLWTAVSKPGETGSLSGVRAAGGIPFADVNPYGANFFLEREPDAWTRRHTVEMAAAAGIRWAKQHFLWSELERQAGYFDWAKYDELVELYREHGLEVIARLDWPPAWVRSDYAPGLNNLPEDPNDYARFVAAVAGHYRGRVRFYQIWNEPNLLAEWGNRLDHPVNPAEYVALLRLASQAIRQADPDAVIISAPLAMNLETVAVAGNMNELDYLEGMYRAGAARYFDILGANAFGMDRPPEDPPSPTVLNFRRVELQRAIMERHRDGNKAIWFNEYGWNAAPAEMSPDLLVWRRVSEEDQAAWTLAGFRWAEENWPWAGVMNIWYFRQWGGKSPDEPDYYFAMVDPDFTPRRLYSAIGAVASQPAVAGVGTWGERSLPVRLGRLADWRWRFASGAQDGNALYAVRPSASLTFSFRGGALAVRLWRGPSAGKLRFRVTGKQAKEGWTTIDLRAPRAGWEWFELLAPMPSSHYDLDLVAGEGGEVAIDSFRVDPGPSPPASRLSTVVFGLGMVLFGLMLFLNARRIVRAVWV